MLRVLLSLTILAALAAVGFLLCQRYGTSWAHELWPVPVPRTTPATDAQAWERRAPVQPAPAPKPQQEPPRAEPAPTAPHFRDVPPVTIGKRTHVVQPGETLWVISQRYYGSPEHRERIADANGLSAPNRLRPGMVLVLPEIAGVPIADCPQAPRAPDSAPASSQNQPAVPMPPTLDRRAE